MKPVFILFFFSVFPPCFVVFLARSVSPKTSFRPTLIQQLHYRCDRTGIEQEVIGKRYILVTMLHHCTSSHRPVIDYFPIIACGILFLTHDMTNHMIPSGSYHLLGLVNNPFLRAWRKENVPRGFVGCFIKKILKRSLTEVLLGTLSESEILNQSGIAFYIELLKLPPER